MTEPITFELTLACSPRHAFETYTGRIGDWWDPRYTANADTFEGVTVEDGRIVERHRDGAQYEWGSVTVWDPDRRFVHSFALAQDPANPSEVSVEFEPDGDGCRVRFAHGGWNEANAADRKKFGDWPVLLDRYAALAEAR